MLYQNIPTLARTQTEYRLFIHPEIKDRAKGIRGYKWDPHRRCWTYPLTKASLKALVTEFGDTLEFAGQPTPDSGQSDGLLVDLLERIEIQAQNLQLTLEASELSDAKQELESRCSELEGEIAELSSRCSELRTNNAMLLHMAYGTEDMPPELSVVPDYVRVQLDERDATIEHLEAELDAAQRDLIEAIRQRDAALAERDEIRHVAASQADHWSAAGWAKEIALQATGNDDKFADVLRRIDLDDGLPRKMATFLARELHAMLSVPIADRRASLYELIREAGDEELLDADAVQLAHTIRRQGNVIAHSEGYAKTYPARSMLCLFAAALLWPELPE